MEFCRISKSARILVQVDSFIGFPQTEYCSNSSWYTVDTVVIDCFVCLRNYLMFNCIWGTKHWFPALAAMVGACRMIIQKGLLKMSRIILFDRKLQVDRVDSSRGWKCWIQRGKKAEILPSGGYSLGESRCRP